MAALYRGPSHQLQKFVFNRLWCNYSFPKFKVNVNLKSGVGGGSCCSAIAIDAPSLAHVSIIRWGSTQQQGPREEMEDDLIIVPSEDPECFSFAAVFDGHAGFSSVKFLRNELYRECVAALDGFLKNGKELERIKIALQEAFQSTDLKLLNWLETGGEGVESGSTATVILIQNDILFISHVGDSSVVLSRGGKADVLTNSHRPYGRSKACLQEIRRIRESGGWIVNGRICGDIAVSRAFGDMRFKTKKEEMLKKGVEEGRWSEKFTSRVQFKGDLVSVCPDVSHIFLRNDAEFIILASDGLWDYMNSSDVVDFVRNQLREHGDAQIACEALCQTALDRGSQDNISIIVADLGKTDWQSLPPEKENVVFELGQAVATLGIVSFGLWMSYQLQM